MQACTWCGISGTSSQFYSVLTPRGFQPQEMGNKARPAFSYHRPPPPPPDTHHFTFRGQISRYKGDKTAHIIFACCWPLSPCRQPSQAEGHHNSDPHYQSWAQLPFSRISSHRSQSSFTVLPIQNLSVLLELFPPLFGHSPIRLQTQHLYQHTDIKEGERPLEIGTCIGSACSQVHQLNRERVLHTLPNIIFTLYRHLSYSLPVSSIHFWIMDLHPSTHFGWFLGLHDYLSLLTSIFNNYIHTYPHSLRPVLSASFLSTSNGNYCHLSHKESSGSSPLITWACKHFIRDKLQG